MVKKFDMKDENMSLIATISSNLLLFNSQTFELKEQINIKEIVSVTPLEQGSVQIEENVKGIIFDSKKVVTLEFQN